jgi:pyruvate,water dikinase
VLQLYNDYRDKYPITYELSELEKIWYHLIRVDYLKTEGTYFWQIFINTIRQTLFKDKLLKYVGYDEYLKLLGGLDNISHLLPSRDIWQISRKIVADEESLNYWTTEPNEAIAGLYEAGSAKYNLGDLRQHIEAYGYHSDKELDVTHPCYFEDTNRLINMIKEALVLPPESFAVDPEVKQKQLYREQMEVIRGRVSAKKYEKLLNSVEDMRSLLWWREELRDTSTRLYYIIRIYTLKLAAMYVEKGLLDRVDDVFYLKIDDLCGYIDGQIDDTRIKELVTKNRRYYNSFRNYVNPNELGSIYDTRLTQKAAKSSAGQLTGVGCNTGVVTGTARVVSGLEEISRLLPGDILVTKYTDTGWTSKFAIIKGVVTERGGILCHAASVSREFGIPCVVCADNATTLIKDGSTIQINGATGEIRQVHG